MTGVATEALLLSDQVWAQLDALSNVNTYDSEITDANGNPTDPPADGDGRVAAYAVFYPSPGWARTRMMGGPTDELDWSFQVTCVGGDRTRCLWCAGRVREQIAGMSLTNAAGQTIGVQEIGDSGPVLRDEDVEPPRIYTPLRFTATA